MKKLMIAAAAAAMIGGVQADIGGVDITGTAYDVKVSLKTTVNATKKATVTYYLGMNSDSTLAWYQDTTLTITLSGYTGTTLVDIIAEDLATTTKGFEHLFTTKTISGKTVPCLSSAGKKNYVLLYQITSLGNTDKKGQTIEGTYGYMSGGKWCDSFSVTDEHCYRTAGTVTVSGYLVDDCCMTASAYDLLHVFGAATYGTSKKAEVYASDFKAVIDVLQDKNGSLVVAKDNKKNQRTINVLSIAGQGAYGKVKENDGAGDLTEKAGATSLSGYAVGTCDSVQCTSCCIPGTVSQEAWNCDGTDAADSATAAYGTFSIKYNASITK